jgi:hypothetical protein
MEEKKKMYIHIRGKKKAAPGNKKKMRATYINVFMYVARIFFFLY